MKLDEKQIIRAIETIVDRGENPTNEKVRIELGATGSMATISPVLRAWKEKQKSTAAAVEKAPQAISDKITRYADDIWAIARDLANNRLDADRQVFLLEKDKLIAHQNSLESDIIALDIELDRYDKENTALVSSLDDAMRTIKELKADALATREEMTVLKIQRDAEIARNQELREDLAQTNSKNEELFRLLAQTLPKTGAAGEV